MKLFHSDASPYARKCRVVVHELGLEDRVELVATKVAPGAPNREYGEGVNPLRRVPALLADDGSLIVDSRVVTEYLAHVAGDRALYPDGEKRWRVLSDAALAEGILDVAVSTRYETFTRPEALRWDAWVDDMRDRALSVLDRFEAAGVPVAGGGPGEPIDIAGITLGCALGYLDFRFPWFGWRDGRPGLVAWYERVATRVSFSATVPKG